MIHLNQAGTSWPKPAAVRQAAAAALEADPARLAADFERHHQGIAAWLGVPSGQLLLTPGGTSALAVGLAALGLAAGDRVLCSSMEHHALHGPLLGLQQRGVQLRVAPRDAGPLDLEQVERELRQGVRLVACCSAANVTGERMPVEELSALCRRYGALLLLDAAQEVGWERRPLPSLGADLVAFAGHKALHGTWGIGGLWAGPDVEFRGPSGQRPGWCDAGSVDRAALAGLAAAIEWLDAPAQAGRLARARALADRFAAAVPRLGSGPFLPTVAFTVPDWRPAQVAAHFATCGVLVSGGHQCAPLAHQALGTGPDGAVRVSFGAQSQDEHVDAALDALATLG